MSFMKGDVILITLFCISSGVFVEQSEQGYNVTYASTSICGLRGSFVDILCTYSYPVGRRIEKTYRHIGSLSGHEDNHNLSLDSRYQGRVEYLGDKVDNCTMRFKDLKESDTQEGYRFRFITDDQNGKFSGEEVFVTLTDLHVSMSPNPLGNNKVILTCNTTCGLSNNPTYIWYRNSQPLPNHTTSSNTLSIPSADKDLYSCAVRGHEAHPSPECVLSGWSVTYTPAHLLSHSIRALKGSSVELHSYYTYPCGYIVTKTLWFIRWSNAEPDDLIEDADYRGRVTYSGDNKNSHILTIRNLICSDSNDYRFRFHATHVSDGKAAGKNLHLSVTELQVLVDPATVKEGDKVTLTCSTTSSMSNNPSYTWYRNSQPVDNLHTTDNQLAIDSVSTEDAGTYSCAVMGHEIHRSPEMTLSVRHAPRNTSASVHPSGEPVEGSSVTLTCSSDANPPVHNYTWYRRKNGSECSWIGQGQSYSICNIGTEHSGLYYCKAQNELGASDSNATFLDVFYSPRNTSASLSPSGDLHEGDSVTLTCSSDANPPAHSYTWYRKTGDETVLHGTRRMPNLTLHLVPGVDGLYHCEAQNKVGSKNSTVVRIFMPDSGLRSTILFSALGAILAVTLLLVIVFVCWRRQKTNSAKTAKYTHSNTKGVCNPASCDTSMDCDTGQIDVTDRKNDDDDDDDDGVQYASVQFKPNKQQEVPSQDKDVQYASVHFSKSKPEPNISEPPSVTPQEETQNASVNLQGLSAATQTGAEFVIYSAVNTNSKP